MKFFLFRHAEKATLGSLNPPLSHVGIEQAENLMKMVQSQRIPKPQALWASPKIRAQQTFQPLAEFLGLEVITKNELDEKMGEESTTQFRLRIQRVINEVATATENLFLCTHMDWADEALGLIPSDSDLLDPKYSYWSSGQYMAFDYEDGLFRLKHFASLPTERILP